MKPVREWLCELAVDPKTESVVAVEILLDRHGSKTTFTRMRQDAAPRFETIPDYYSKV
jgi:hypothetical protein